MLPAPLKHPPPPIAAPDRRILCWRKPVHLPFLKPSNEANNRAARSLMICCAKASCRPGETDIIVRHQRVRTIDALPQVLPCRLLSNILFMQIDRRCVLCGLDCVDGLGAGLLLPRCLVFALGLRRPTLLAACYRMRSPFPVSIASVSTRSIMHYVCIP